MSEIEDIVAAGLGFRRADDFTDWLARERNAAFEAAVASRSPKKKRERRPRPNIRALIEDAERSDKRVSAVIVNGVTLTFGTSNLAPAATNADFNEWDRDLGTNTAQVRQ